MKIANFRTSHALAVARNNDGPAKDGLRSMVGVAEVRRAYLEVLGW